MRFVEITIPAGKREAILKALDDEGVDYVVSEETSNREFTDVVSFPLPAEAVEPVLDRLEEVGLDDDAYTIILSAETVISRRFDQLRDRYAESDTDERISREEIRGRVRDFVPDFETYSVMLVASVAIATAGVLLDSAAVVVGSMVIAPLVGPAMATSVGTVLQDRDLFLRGTRLQTYGLLLALVTATVFAWVVKSVHLIPPGIDVVSIGQVRERLAPDFLSLAIAIGAGVAGSYSLSAGVSTALVGVMIAVALVPPIAVVGIGIAWGLPSVVLGAAVLALVNFLSINLAALVVLWYQGYRPKYWFRAGEARSDTIKGVAVLVAVIAVLSVFLAGVTYSSYETATTEQAVRAEVEAVLEHPDYRDLELIGMSFESDRGRFLSTPERVVVTVGRQPGQTYPDLLEDLTAAVSDVHDLAVEVRFVDVVQSR